MTTQLTAEDLTLTKDEEGYESKLYHDVGGVPTIGYGTTASAGVVDPLPETCTEPEATGWLLAFANKVIVPAILATGFVPNKDQLIALVDLGYEEGPSVFDAGRSMGDALRSKDLDRIESAFMLYVYDDGEVLLDLVHRREAERARFAQREKHEPTFHYDWYPATWVETVKRYDEQCRLESSSLTRLAALRGQCRGMAHYIAFQAEEHHPLADGKPSWALMHRGWLFQELIHRAQGKIVKPQ